MLKWTRLKANKVLCSSPPVCGLEADALGSIYALHLDKQRSILTRGLLAFYDAAQLI